MALIVGLTGGIGAGKSTVAAMFESRGAEVIDVDALGHDVLEPDGGAFDTVVEAFGRGVLAHDGSIDRAALGAAVFGPNGRLGELESISHPVINDLLSALITATSSGLIVLDMAVLVESELGWIGGAPVYERVVIVEADPAIRVQRLAGRGLSAHEALERMGAQVGDAERRMLADVVLVNNAGLADLGRKVEQLWPTIEAWQSQSESHE